MVASLPFILLRAELRAPVSFARVVPGVRGHKIPYSQKARPVARSTGRAFWQNYVLPENTEEISRQGAQQEHDHYDRRYQRLPAVRGFGCGALFQVLALGFDGGAHGGVVVEVGATKDEDEFHEGAEPGYRPEAESQAGQVAGVSRKDGHVAAMHDQVEYPVREDHG